MKTAADDIEWVKELKNNSQPALSRIFHKYWKELYLYALKFTREEYMADEIVQNLFIKLWEKRAELTIQSLSHYLYVSVKNRCIDYVRGRLKQEKEWKHYSRFLPTATFSPEEEYVSTELVESLWLRLGLLPEKSRAIFKKNKIEGLTVSEIAKMMNLSKKTVEYHLTKANKIIKK